MIDSSLVFPYLLQLLLLRARKVVVFGSLGHDLGGAQVGTIAHEVVVVDGLIEFVGEVGFALLKVEQRIGRAVHILARRSGQTYQQGIEIVEDGAILAKDGAVCLVDDDKVETADGEDFLIGIDITNHGLVGREHDSCLQVGCIVLR